MNMIKEWLFAMLFPAYLILFTTLILIFLR